MAFIAASFQITLVEDQLDFHKPPQRRVALGARVGEAAGEDA